MGKPKTVPIYRNLVSYSFDLALRTRLRIAVLGEIERKNSNRGGWRRCRKATAPTDNKELGFCSWH